MLVYTTENCGYNKQCYIKLIFPLYLAIKVYPQRHFQVGTTVSSEKNTHNFLYITMALFRVLPLVPLANVPLVDIGTK